MEVFLSKAFNPNWLDIAPQVWVSIGVGMWVQMG